jgi:septal ring factor EnvC (AmiA/AmiB activator)
MGLGSTAKKLQKVADIAEQLFKRINAMRSEIQDLQGAVEGAETDAAELRRELAETRALVEAIAEAEGVDTEAVLADIEYPEPAGRTAADHAAADTGDDGEESAA